MSGTAPSSVAAEISPPLCEFGPFRLDAVKRTLSRDGRAVSLTPKALDVLMVLVENRHRPLDKDELMRTVWPDTVVEENNLARNVSALRRALGEKASDHSYVVTIPGRGYRFVAPVREVAPGAEGDPMTLAAEATATSASVAGPPPAVGRRPLFLAGLLGLAVLLLAASLGWHVWRYPRPAGRLSSLAVLPFDNLSGDPDQDYVADGITDAVITELSGIRSLRVISRQSIVRYQGSRAPLPQIARELGVDAIVEGTALRSDGRVRVTVQLLHGPSDRHLWARTYERDIGDVLALQTQIARSVAEEIRAAVTGPERARLTRNGRADAQAYDLYLRGRYFYNQRGVGDPEPPIRKSIEYLQQAVEKDPQLAEAHAALSSSYGGLAYRGLIAPAEAAPAQEAHARRALELDPLLADAQAAMATSRAFVHRDWAGAEERFQRAIELSPGDTGARLMYGVLLLDLGRFEEALAQNEQGLRSDPFNTLLAGNLAAALFELGRHEEALQRMREAIEIEPARADHLGWLLLNMGRTREAFEEFERTRSERGLAHMRALRGDPSGLRGLLARLEERARRRYVSPLEFVPLLAALGEKDRAFALLEEAYRTRVPALMGLNMYARRAWTGCAWPRDLGPLSGDPRYRDLLRRMKLD